jgi:CBS domain-containing protein
VDKLVIAALRGHAPFDEMDEASLKFLASRLQLAYYPGGETLLAPQRGEADRLYIIKQGSVRGSGAAATDVVLGAGECFPIGALIGKRPTANTYRAAGDCFCWELPAPDFHRLVERSREFHAFCTGYLARLVERSQSAQRAEAAQALLDGSGMLTPLKGSVAREPVSCGPATPLGEVLRTMHAARVGSMVVVDGARVPLGIFTQPDILERVALPGLPMDTPIERVMTARPVTLEEEASLADAALAMARHGIRHVVVTRGGRLRGVVTERDLFALSRTSMTRISERIRAARDSPALAAAAAEVRELARQWLAHGVAAEQLTAMASALNDALSRRLIELAAARRALPGPWCWLALGSEGRMEQTFVTDQDNALIIEGPAAPFLDFAGEVNQGLAAAGFPLCKGEIMARNPRWCLSAQDWRRVFDDWIRNPQPQALLHASIFFDLRPLAGETRLAGALREAVLAQASASRSFQRALAQSALESAPPLGLLSSFAAAELDLKASGARLFVDAARVLCLAAGSAQTGTAARLRDAHEAGAADAFHYVQGLRLKHGNRVRVAALGEIDRRVLKEAFRQAALLQDRLRMDYQL